MKAIFIAVIFCLASCHYSPDYGFYNYQNFEFDEKEICFKVPMYTLEEPNAAQLFKLKKKYSEHSTIYSASSRYFTNKETQLRLTNHYQVLSKFGKVRDGLSGFAVGNQIFLR